MEKMVELIKWAAWLGPIGFVLYQAIKFATEKNISVKQGEVAIVENTLTGALHAVPQGLHPINQFYQRVVREGVSIKNRPVDPKPVDVKTKNLTGIKVDLAIIRRRITDPLRATQLVDYERLDEIVDSRINVLIQKAFGKADIEDIFEEEAIDPADAGAAKGKKMRVNGARVEQLLESATNEINSELSRIAPDEWSMEIEVAVQNIFLPQKMQDVAEDITTEDAEAIRIKKRAGAYGVNPEELLKLDAQTQIGGLVMNLLGGALGKGRGK